MSHEKNAFDASEDSPNVEKRSFNVDYEEYISSVKEIGDSSESIKEPVKSNAEDEVVAILLSAMMGSIVKDWSIKPSLHASKSAKSSGDAAEILHEIFSPKASEVKNQTIIEGLASQESVNKQDRLNSRKKTEEKRKTTTSNYPTSSVNIPLNGSNMEEKLDSIKKNGSIHTRSDTTPMKSSDKEEEESFTQLKKLNELLINDKDNIYGWEFLESGQEFIITFKQGNRYEGRLLNCRMHGEGKFHWADGSVYEGEFSLGKMTGKGKLYWPDGSWYEGELRRGYRHGRGLYVLAPTFYAGYWKCGRRQGAGAMFYNHFDTNRHYYNGEWLADKKHGTGLRSYPSGAMYSGQWKSGKCHGLGTMVWTNCDVYSGNFQQGKMHGYGEYTWDTFFNQQLVVPEENCYYGNWERNVRHGNGTLETVTGVFVKGSWKNGTKHGPAEVICSNGNFLYADNLFEEDNICLPDGNIEVDSLMNASVQSLYQLPVSAACHEINLGYYVNRLVEFINDCSSLGKPFCVSPRDSPINGHTKRTFSFNRSFEPEENKIDFDEEETHIRNVLLQFLSSLKVIYSTYAQVCCEVKPSFSTILMRLMWWQLLRDCDLHSRGLSLADFDICISNNKACLVQGVHYPFERLLFWQFLHCLIEVSWELYAKRCIGTPSVKGVIASGLHKLITTDLIPNAGRHKGNALFRCRDLISFDSLYWYYRGVGEPHSAREFLKQAAVPQESDVVQDNVPKYQEHQIKGKNMIGVGGKLTYFPKKEPLLTNIGYQDDPTHPKNISCLSSIGLLSILECILQICPSISTGELLVNMDYKIVFLEFYEILLLCACKKARNTILERKKKYEEEESKTASPQNDTADDHPPLEEPEEDLPPPPKSSQRKKSSEPKKPKKKK